MARPRTVPDKFCEYCGKPFRPHDKDRFCSQNCFHAAIKEGSLKKRTKTCPMCGKTFIDDTHNRKMYCSLQCVGQAKRTLFKKKCAYCEKSFQPKSHTQQYCSIECRQQSRFTKHPQAFICRHCGKLFEKITYPSRKPPQYCSDECAHHGTPETRFICQQCGKCFNVRMYPSIKRTPQYCCYECSAKDKARPTRKCKICGNEFQAAISHGKRSQCCSPECRAISQFKYPKSLRDIAAGLCSQIGFKETAKILNIPEFHVRLIAERRNIEIPPEVRYRYYRENPSGLDIQLYEHLRDLQVNYVPQKPIGHYIVDALIMPNIVIEADGDYWHGHERFKPLNAHQKHRQSHDKAKNTYLTNHGYIVIRIWESDMSLERVHQELVPYLD